MTAAQKIVTVSPGFTVAANVDVQNPHVSHLLSAMGVLFGADTDCDWSFEAIDDIASKYFHPDYEQHVDGKVRLLHGVNPNR